MTLAPALQVIEWDRWRGVMAQRLAALNTASASSEWETLGPIQQLTELARARAVQL